MKKRYETPDRPIIYVGCPDCSGGYGMEIDFWIVDIILHKKIECEKCGNAYQALDGVLSGMRIHRTTFRNDGLFELFGARKANFRIPYGRDSPRFLELSRFGLSADAFLIELRVSLMVSQNHHLGGPTIGLDNVSAYDRPQRRIELVPFEGMEGWASNYGKGNLDKAELDIWLTWIEGERYRNSKAEITAVELFHRGDLPSAVVTASAGVEASLFELCNAGLKSTIPKKKRESFLSGAATFSTQLDVLLNVVCKMHSLTPIPSQIIGKLSRLRRLRNEVAHKAKFKTDVTEEEVYELLCYASICNLAFGVIRKQIAGSSGANDI